MLTWQGGRLSLQTIRQAHSSSPMIRKVTVNKTLGWLLVNQRTINKTPVLAAGFILYLFFIYVTADGFRVTNVVPQGNCAGITRTFASLHAKL